MPILYNTGSTQPAANEERPRSDFTNSGALAALNAEVLVVCDGDTCVGVDVRGTYTGVLSFDGTIDGTNFFPIPAIDQDTQAVVTAAASAATGAWLVWVGGMKQLRVRMTSYTSGTATVTLRASLAEPSVGIFFPPPSTLWVTATAAVNTALTATLPAGGVGLFHYITSIELVKLYSVVGVANGAGVLITTTNLPGSPVWTTEQLASAAGTAPIVIDRLLASNPLKSSVANTATTFVAPAQLQTIWRWNIAYYLGA